MKFFLFFTIAASAKVLIPMGNPVGVRLDKIVGTGTLTYVDPETNEFGALGHAIFDGSKDVLSFEKGVLHDVSIESVVKSKPGQPGYKNSKLKGKIGLIDDNTTYGIFGTIDTEIELNEPMEIGSNIQLGSAKMLTALDSEQVESYTIEITDIGQSDFQFEVIDKEVVQKTGGIVQGMSGSPIIQNGKFVGVITHMYVESPKTGMGIPIEIMIQKD